MPPIFITLDGMDGSGKTTQLSLLRDALRACGHGVVVCRDPGTTPLGNAVRDILLHRHDCPISDVSEMLLFMAARAQLVREVIRPALDAGKIVLCDRYLLATQVYQGVAGDVPMATIDQVAGLVLDGIVHPTLGLVFDVSLEVSKARMAASRRTADRFESKGDAYYQRVRHGFLDLAGRDPLRYITINAAAPPEDVARMVWAYVAGHCLTPVDAD